MGTVPPSAVAEIDVGPLERDQLAEPQAGVDRGCDEGEGVALARGVEHLPTSMSLKFRGSYLASPSSLGPTGAPSLYFGGGAHLWAAGFWTGIRSIVAVRKFP